MINLHRITTEYIDTEDRIRLSGETENDETVVLWITQRLLAQVISHLLRLIEEQSLDLSDPDSSTRSLRQGFEQQIAQSELKPEAPVRAREAAENWLILEVDVALSPEGTLVLVFKREAGEAAKKDEARKASLTIEAKQLRQWMGIVHAQWQNAGWPLSVWPAWMDEQESSGTTGSLH